MHTSRSFDRGVQGGVHVDKGGSAGLSASLWDQSDMQMSASDVDYYLMRYVDSSNNLPWEACCSVVVVGSACVC